MNFLHHKHRRHQALKTPLMFCVIRYFGEVMFFPGEKTDSHVTEKTGRLGKWVSPVSSEVHNPGLNPGMDQNISRIGCRRIMVILSEKDKHRERGLV